MRPALLLLTALTGAAALAGCDKTMTEQDCRAIGDNLKAAWLADAAAAQAKVPTADPKARPVINGEGTALASEWLAECKRDLVDTSLSARERSCLLAAKTTDAVASCLPAK